MIIILSCLIKIKRMEKSITIELPLNWYKSKWIGFALWASLSISESLGMMQQEYFKDGIRARVIALSNMPQYHCAFELFTTTILCEVNICLLYLSRDDWFAKVGKGKCNQIKVIFEPNDLEFHVEGCGVSLVYEQDVDEFDQTNAQYLIESFGKEVSICKLTGKTISTILPINGQSYSILFSFYLYIWFCHWQVSQVIFFVLLAHHTPTILITYFPTS